MIYFGIRVTENSHSILWMHFPRKVSARPLGWIHVTPQENSIHYVGGSMPIAWVSITWQCASSQIWWSDWQLCMVGRRQSGGWGWLLLLVLFWGLFLDTEIGKEPDKKARPCSTILMKRNSLMMKLSITSHRKKVNWSVVCTWACDLRSNLREITFHL